MHGRRRHAGDGLDMRILITILMLSLLSGCTGMLLGADVTPAQQSDTDKDDESRKEK